MRILYILENSREKSGILVNSQHLKKMLKITGYNISIFPTSKSETDRSLTKRLQSAIGRSDIVHLITTPEIYRTLRSAIDIVLCQNKNCVVSLRGDIRQKDFTAIPNKNEDKFRQLLARPSTSIIGITKNQVNEMFQHYKIRKKQFTLAPPGILDYVQNFGQQKIKREFDCIFVGKACEAKGLDLFLRMVAKFPNIRARVITSGDINQDINFKKLASKLGVVSRIKWSFELPNKKALREIAKSKILVLPTKAESWGNVLTEAMLCKTAVIASNIGGVPEVLKDGELGKLAEVGNLKDLCNILEKLLKDEEQNTQIIERAYWYAKENYTLSKQANLMEKFYLNMQLTKRDSLQKWDFCSPYEGSVIVYAHSKGNIQNEK